MDKAPHTNWAIHCWTNAEIRSIFPELIPRLARIGSPLCWLSNIVRYALLYIFGEVYLGTDIVPLCPLDDLLDAYQNFTICEEPRLEPPLEGVNHLLYPYAWYNCTTIGNAVIAFPPKNPVLFNALEISIKNSENELNKPPGERKKYGSHFSGPGMWTNEVSWTTNILYTSTFIPVTGENFQLHHIQC